eukprot:2911479-Amphidinium_carterae.1
MRQSVPCLQRGAVKEETDLLLMFWGCFESGTAQVFHVEGGSSCRKPRIGTKRGANTETSNE